MKEFTGRISKEGSDWYFESKYCGVDMCHDLSRAVLESYDTPCWGFQSPGTQRLAAVMLGMALTACGREDFVYEEDEDGNRDEEPTVVMPAIGFTNWDWSVTTYERSLKTIKRHYQKFADEVLANLPDRWEMSRQEILEWIKKQENENNEPTTEQTKPKD